MSPAARRAVAVLMLVGVAAAALATVTPSLARILDGARRPRPAPPWLWQSHVYAAPPPPPPASSAPNAEPGAPSRRRYRPPVAKSSPAAPATDWAPPPAAEPVPPPPAPVRPPAHVFVMQENRSFDEYFGTFPGADGIPAGTCVPDPATGDCVAAYHDPSLVDYGGPHSAAAALADIHGGAMDGFVGQGLAGRRDCHGINDPYCAPPGSPLDVMGYHDAREIPNYWDYARSYVLQDHMFEPNYGWSLPAHLWTVSGWSARCATPSLPMTCHTDLRGPGAGGSGKSGSPGRTSPTCCTPTASAGATTSRPGGSQTARAGR